MIWQNANVLKNPTIISKYKSILCATSFLCIFFIIDVVFKFCLQILWNWYFSLKMKPKNPCFPKTTDFYFNRLYLFCIQIFAKYLRFKRNTFLILYQMIANLSSIFLHVSVKYCCFLKFFSIFVIKRVSLFPYNEEENNETDVYRNSNSIEDNVHLNSPK